MSEPKPSEAVQENATASQLGFILHPLPLLNMSDYYTRARLTGVSNHVGILFGTRTERDISVENAFEVKFAEGGEKIDQAFLSQRIALYKTTFPAQDAVGWYHIRSDSTTLQPDEVSLNLHEQMQLQEEFDLSLMLFFNPEATANTTQLPLKVFELVFRDQGVEFAEVSVRVETGDAERIGVDDIMKGESLSKGQSLETHLSTEANAIKMLHARLTLLRDYVKAVGEKEVEPNHQVLRQIKSFMSRLSRERGKNLQSILDEQELGVLSAGLMAAIAKGDRVGVDITAKRSVMTFNPRDVQTHHYDRDDDGSVDHS